MNKKTRIIAILGVIIIGGIFFYSIMQQADRNIERSLQSNDYKPSDFIEKEYKIEEIWVREFTHPSLPSLNQSYIFFTVENQEFNFNFGSQFSNFGNSNDKVSGLLKYLKTGLSVKILANKNDLKYASDNSIKRSITDFFNGTNKEVEVYKLSIGNDIIINQDITSPNFSNRGFADMAISKNLPRLLLVLAAFVGLTLLLSKVFKKKEASINN